jgi:hypothetical protein
MAGFAFLCGVVLGAAVMFVVLLALPPRWFDDGGDD